MIWKYTFPLHNKLKTPLLTSIQYSVGKGYDADEFDRITKTDYYEHLDLDQKTYLRLLHSNLTDFYDVMSQKYCLLDFSLYNGWYQQYYNLDTHHWHTHSRSNVSMVYYLELDGPEHSTEFWCPETRKKFQLDAKEGDIVVFPHIRHTVLLQYNLIIERLSSVVTTILNPYDLTASMANEFLWVEKYRPRKIEDCILTDQVKSTFQSFLDNGEIPNFAAVWSSWHW